MRTTFSGLEIGLRALQAHRKALEVTGHNIANASTDGYSRQEVSLRPAPAYPVPGLVRTAEAGQVGTGVMVEEIRRVRDSFLDYRFRSEASGLGEWETRKEVLAELEVIINEPSDTGLRAVMDEFWAALQELAGNPESAGVRAGVIQRAAAVADAFTHTQQQVRALEDDIGRGVAARVADLNVMAEEIARINRQVSQALATGDRPNDLEDRRDYLLDRIARIAGGRAEFTEAGTVSVFIGGAALVYGRNAHPVELDDAGTLRWTVTGSAVSVPGGELRGFLDLRDIILPRYRTEIEEVATALADGINGVHRSGFGLDGTQGLDMFLTGGSRLLAVNPELLVDARKVAASASGEPGDGANALAMARVKHSVTAAGATVDDLYRGVVARLGVESAGARRLADNQRLLTLQVENQRQGVSGVSLDEEVTKMIRYQHAYNAAARYVAAVDEMMDTLVNRVGLVGR